MPSATFSSSRSYVRRSRRKGANRIPLPSRTSSGKLLLCSLFRYCMDSSHQLVEMSEPYIDSPKLYEQCLIVAPK